MARVVEEARASTHRLLVLVLFVAAEIETVECHCHCRRIGEKTSLVCMN